MSVPRRTIEVILLDILERKEFYLAQVERLIQLYREHQAELVKVRDMLACSGIPDYRIDEATRRLTSLIGGHRDESR